MKENLSRLRSSIISAALSLAQIAASMDLGRWLVLGAGELKTGGDRRESILANGASRRSVALFIWTVASRLRHAR